MRAYLRAASHLGIQLEMSSAYDIQTEQSADKADDAENFYPWHFSFALLPPRSTLAGSSVFSPSCFFFFFFLFLSR